MQAKKLSYPLVVNPEDLTAFEQDISLPGIGEALQRAGLVVVRESCHV